MVPEPAQYSALLITWKTADEKALTSIKLQGECVISRVMLTHPVAPTTCLECDRNSSKQPSSIHSKACQSKTFSNTKTDNSNWANNSTFYCGLKKKMQILLLWKKKNLLKVIVFVSNIPFVWLFMLVLFIFKSNHSDIQRTHINHATGNFYNGSSTDDSES